MLAKFWKLSQLAQVDGNDEQCDIRNLIIGANNKCNICQISVWIMKLTIKGFVPVLYQTFCQFYNLS